MLDQVVFSFLRWFTQFRELETIATLATRDSEALRSELASLRYQHEKATERVSELVVERESLETDLENLRVSHEEILREKLLLEDRVQTVFDDRQRLWDVVREALGSERNALRAQVNHAVQRVGGGIVYPESHSLPRDVIPKKEAPGPVGRRGRMLSSQAAVLNSKRFIAEEFLPEIERSSFPR